MTVEVDDDEIDESLESLAEVNKELIRLCREDDDLDDEVDGASIYGSNYSK